MVETMSKYNLICGDCLQKMQAIPDASIDLILCDLPYGTTNCKWDSVIPFEPLWKQYNRIIKKNSAIVLFGSEPFSSFLRMSNIKNYKYDWVWHKRNAGNVLVAKYQPLKTTENIIVFCNNTCRYYPILTEATRDRSKDKPTKKKSDIFSSIKSGLFKRGKNIGGKMRYPKHLIEFSNADHHKQLHPTQKPVALLEYLVKTYTNAGDVVLDNCMGSGSTGVACANTDRDFIGIELDENYFNIAKNRIEAAYNAPRLFTENG